MNLLLLSDDLIRIYATSYHHPGLVNQFDDLSSYEPGGYYVNTQRRSPREPFSNNWQQLRWESTQSLMGVSSVAFASARTHRGEVLPTSAATSVGLASFPALSAVIAPAVRWGALPLSLGAGATGALAALIAIKPAFGLAHATAKGIRWFRDIDYKLRHIELGGSYEDTSTAANLRMRSVRDMSSTFGNSRKWLGQEASYYSRY